MFFYAERVKNKSTKKILGFEPKTFWIPVRAFCHLDPARGAEDKLHAGSQNVFCGFISHSFSKDIHKCLLLHTVNNIKPLK